VTTVVEPTSALRIPTFRRLWWGLSSSSLGDWLGLLALTAMANQMVEGYAAKNYAIAGVLFLRVTPALVIGPLAGYVADHMDRRTVLVWGDHVRGLLFLSIPVVGELWWVFVVTVLIETVSVVWGPAKDATVPNLVPPRLLEGANAVSTAATYGSAVPAAAFFAALTSLDRLVPEALGWAGGAVNVALVVNGVTFIVSGLIIATLHDIPRGPAHADGESNLVRAILHGWGYVVRTRVVRGLVTGMVGAFAAGGVVVGLARTHVSDLGGGDAGYGLLFGAVFTGMGFGIWRGNALVRRFDRRQVFGAALVGCGVVLVPLALVRHLEIVAILAVVVGGLAGTAWINGMTLLGLEVPDQLRGRTFAFVGSAVRLALGLVLAVGPLAAGAIGTLALGGVSYAGAAVTILGAAVLLTGVGVVSYRLMHESAGHEGRSG
jgi:dTMP kinase